MKLVIDCWIFFLRSPLITGSLAEKALVEKLSAANSNVNPVVIVIAPE